MIKSRGRAGGALSAAITFISRTLPKVYFHNLTADRSVSQVGLNINHQICGAL